MLKKKELLKYKQGLLRVLLSDVETFGPAGNDLSRIETLEKEIIELTGELNNAS